MAVAPCVTEQQKYDVIARFDDIELRTYAPCVVADIVVTGSMEQAGNSAFRPLVSYISGANRSAARLAMTAPVVQEAAGESLAMTAPVLQEPADAADAWTVSFVLPGSRPIEEYPEPTDPRVAASGGGSPRGGRRALVGTLDRGQRGDADGGAPGRDGAARLDRDGSAALGPLRPAVEAPVRPTQRDPDPGGGTNRTYGCVGYGTVGY